MALSSVEPPSCWKSAEARSSNVLMGTLIIRRGCQCSCKVFRGEIWVRKFVLCSSTNITKVGPERRDLDCSPRQRAKINTQNECTFHIVFCVNYLWVLMLAHSNQKEKNIGMIQNAVVVFILRAHSERCEQKGNEGCLGHWGVFRRQGGGKGLWTLSGLGPKDHLLPC